QASLNPMNRISIYELARVLILKNGLDRQDAEHFVSSIFSIVRSALERDSVVKIKGLGTFKIIGVEARESVNVNTGERVVIESHGKVTFTPDATMKELVNKPFSQFETVVLNDGVEFDDMTGGEMASGSETVAEDGLRESDGGVDNVKTGVETVAAAPADEVVERTVGGVGAGHESSQSRLADGRSLLVESAIGDIKEAIDGMGATENSGSDASDEEKAYVPLEIPYSLADLEALPDLPDDAAQNPVDDAPKAVAAGLKAVPQETEPAVVAAESVPEKLSPKSGAYPDDDIKGNVESAVVANPQVAEPVEDTEQEAVEPAVVANPQVVEAAAVEQSSAEISVTTKTEEPVEEPEAASGVSRKWMWLFFISLFLIFIPAAFFGGYFFNKLLSDDAREKPAEEIERAVPANPAGKSDVLQKHAAANPDTLANRRDTLTGGRRADAEKAESASEAERKGTSGAGKESADKTGKATPAEDAPVDYKRYEAMDNRVRTGAYRIVGTLDVRTVKQGETLERISKRTLGEGMECYVEVYNGLERGAKLKAGQQIKIPKLVLKKAARRK
ncbi:MAG: HU family DNA-binding protein, partial [Prevotella sp.]|nr:HU family DNA-binding protein [Prevotella sp.]